MTKKIILTIVGLIVLLGGLYGLKMLQFRDMKAAGESMQMPPETVSSAEVTAAHWKPFFSAIGSVTAAQGVTLSSEVAGTVSRIAFESGAAVKAGDILIELDASTEQAELEAAVAAVDLAAINRDRARTLLSNNTISRSEVDTTEAQFKQAAAEVERLRALIAKKVLRAPFDGTTGIRQVNLGQFVTSGTPIVSLQAPTPVYVDFNLPQQRLAELKEGLLVRAKSDAYPDQAFTGELSAINAEVDPATRNIRLRATFHNEDRHLLPGMFVNVEIELPRDEQLLVIPVTSVIYAPYGDSVFVVEDAKEGEGKVVRQQFIRLGESRGDFVAVTRGLELGQTIVAVGGFKLRNETAVVINNDLAPKPELNPTPADT